MYKECEKCGKPFEAIVWWQRYCSKKCCHNYSKAELKTIAVKKAKNKPVKSLSAWAREARECNLDYGNYRAQVEVFGRNYEELKATAASRQMPCHSHVSSKRKTQ